MKKTSLFIILLSVSLLIACGQADPDSESLVNEKVIEQLADVDRDKDLLMEIEKMTLDEKIGQLMIVGYEGKEYGEELDKKLMDLKPSGFILFSKNIDGAEELLNSLNEIKKNNKLNKNIPLIISLDEEGGSVSRLPESIEKTLTPKEIGQVSDKELLLAVGERLSENVSSFGFNMNNGLVLDINSNPNNQVIADRAFGKDEDRVIHAALNVLEGMNRSRVLNVVKHFPGHGSTERDSHHSLPIIRKDLEALEKFELLPFQAAIESGVDGVMVGHILFPEIDNKYPASLSSMFLKEILRDRYGYEGLIISDDMTMGAITNSQEPEEAAVRFIEAGGDLVLLCHGESIGYNFRNKMKDALESKRISMDEIDDRVYRILKMKEKYNINDEMKDLDDLNIKYMNRETLKLNKKVLESKDMQQSLEGGKDE